MYMNRDLISGFILGFGLSSFCHGLHIIYVGRKLIQISRTMETNDNMDDNMDDVD